MRRSLIAPSRTSVAAVLTLLSVCIALVAPVTAQAVFGLHGFDVTFTNKDGSVATQAGSHPFAMTTSFALNSSVNEASETVPDGELKDMTTEQIVGLVGDPTAVPRCSAADLTTVVGLRASCPDSTAVGVVEVSTRGKGAGKGGGIYPVFALVPPPGVALMLGFVVSDEPVTVEIGVKHEYPYNISAVVSDSPQPVALVGVKLVLWGNPGDPAHDPYRGKCLNLGAGSAEHPVSEGNCPSQIANVPLITLPRACTGPLSTTYQANSWSDPGTWVFGGSETHDNAEPADPLGMTGCSRLGFNPTIAAQPTSKAAQSATGLDFGLNVHDEGLANPGGIAQSDIKKAVVTLPEGMTANPALAEGLNVCSEADLARESVDSAPGEGCPDESKIGTVEVETPLLEEPLKGSLFMAKPHANPFNSLLALYFVIKNPTLGIIIKQAALVEPNPVTGQLVTIVDNIPQLPFSHFTLHFREGARSPLVTPPACGSYDAKAVLTPSSGGEPVTSTSMFQIISGANAGPCPAGGVPPFAPQITAGMQNNNAGSFSPFYLHLTRGDGDAEISSFSTSMPAGLTGILTGIPFCPEADIEMARTKTGVLEQNEPSCPASSQVGHSLVGAGVGSALAYTPGKIYFAGPFHGDPFSLVSVTSAVVGPFDLGTVVIRFGLRIDPRTAQVNVDPSGSEPIPTILDGIVTHVRDVRVYIDRPNFTLNPTSCNPLSISSTLSSNLAQFSTVSSRFQAADCANLKFTPTITATTAGQASRANGASLTVKIAYPKGAIGTQSWVNEAKLQFPKQLPAELKTIQKACLAATFEGNRAACPPQSIIGHAVVHTPILPVPLEGPVYFVSNGGAKFPDAVLLLDGDGVHIELHGETFITRSGVTTATFRNTPDVPFETLEVTVPSGPFSEFGANLPGGGYNFCGEKLVMPTFFKASNGAEIHQNTTVGVTGCPTKLSIKRHKVNGRAVSLSVYAPAAGTLKLTGGSLGTTTKTVHGSETVTLTLHAKRAGHARRKIKVTFAPVTGHKQSASIRLRV